jgi:hypothetical protein
VAWLLIWPPRSVHRRRLHPPPSPSTAPPSASAKSLEQTYKRFKTEELAKAKLRTDDFFEVEGDAVFYLDPRDPIPFTSAGQPFVVFQGPDVAIVCEFGRRDIGKLQEVFGTGILSPRRVVVRGKIFYGASYVPTGRILTKHGIPFFGGTGEYKEDEEILMFSLKYCTLVAP